MKKNFLTKLTATGLIFAMMSTVLAGCRFGFASDPDDPNAEEEQGVEIDYSTDTFAYDTSLKGTKITILNSKAEIQTALEEIGRVYEERSGVAVEIISCGNDSPYTKVVNLYNSGTPPTLAILDTTDIIALAEEKAEVLSGEAWTQECEDYLTYVNDKVYSFPFCIEGRGIIYNKTVIENLLGESFDPDSIHTLDEFTAFLERLVAAGMETPLSMAKEDWSLGAHHLQYIYESFDGTTAGAQDVIEKIKSGELDLASYDRLDEFINTFDVLKKYNVARLDPLGADYDEMAIDLADGNTALWFNGNWAWPNLKEAGAETTDEYGFLPYFMGNDPEDFINTKVQASPSKQVMLDKEKATENQKAAAKQLLNWLVYGEIGQQMLVYTCAVIPACTNNPYEPLDPLSRDLYAKGQEGKTFNASAVVPNDHWSVLGAAMQKYLAGRSDKAELVDSIKAYWAKQN